MKSCGCFRQIVTQSTSKIHGIAVFVSSLQANLTPVMDSPDSLPSNTFARPVFSSVASASRSRGMGIPLKSVLAQVPSVGS